MPHSPEDLMIRGVWKLIDEMADPAAVERGAKLPLTDQPLGDYGELVREMLSAGISTQQIARLKKIIAYEIAFSVLYQLEDNYEAVHGLEGADPGTAWMLFLLDGDTDNPKRPMTGLHSMLLSADPSGDEMRPPCE